MRIYIPITYIRLVPTNCKYLEIHLSILGSVDLFYSIKTEKIFSLVYNGIYRFQTLSESGQAAAGLEM